MADHMKTAKKITDMPDDELYFVDKTPSTCEISCVICMEIVGDTDRTVLKCGHVFHAGCMFTNVVSANNTCPLCRAKVGEKPEARPDLTNPMMRIFIQNEFNKISMNNILRSMFEFSVTKIEEDCVRRWADIEQNHRIEMSEDLIDILITFGMRLGGNVRRWINDGDERLVLSEESFEEPFNVPVSAYIDNDLPVMTTDGAEEVKDDDDTAPLSDENSLTPLQREFLEDYDGIPPLEERIPDLINENGEIQNDTPPSAGGWSDAPAWADSSDPAPGWEPLDGTTFEILPLTRQENIINQPYGQEETTNIEPLFADVEALDTALETNIINDLSEDLEYDTAAFSADWLTGEQCERLQPRLLANEWLADLYNLDSETIEGLMWPVGASATHPLFTREEAEEIMGAIVQYHANSRIEEID